MLKLPDCVNLATDQGWSWSWRISGHHCPAAETAAFHSAIHGEHRRAPTSSQTPTAHPPTHTPFTAAAADKERWTLRLRVHNCAHSLTQQTLLSMTELPSKILGTQIILAQKDVEWLQQTHLLQLHLQTERCWWVTGTRSLRWVSRHPANRSCHQPHKLGRRRQKISQVPSLSKGKNFMREIVWNAHKSYFGDMKKKVLWSLPCRYDNPTPSEAILPPASQARQAA